jgi:hypothetical protein
MLSTLHHTPALIRRKSRQYPKTALLILLSSPLLLLYILLCYLSAYASFARVYWNYSIWLVPSLVYVLPSGGWGPIANGPRFVQEIYDAPWMGEWPVVELTSAVYHTLGEVSTENGIAPQGPDGDSKAVSKQDDEHVVGVEHLDDMTFIADNQTSPESAGSSEFKLEEIVKRSQEGHLPNPSSLSSPSIIKLHIFSTVGESSRQKRHLIRRLSPLYNVPAEYRHLIELKFVLGHSYKIEENWAVNEEMEALMAQEQEQFGDMLRLNLTYGENLRYGKILDWINAVGNGRDGGRDSWWLFKVDDDVSHAGLLLYSY